MSEDTRALPPIVSREAWLEEIAALRADEKAITRQLDALAARRRRLPMMRVPKAACQVSTSPDTTTLAAAIGRR